MQYLMAPLDAHYDNGFGAIAEAFLRAAEDLTKREDPKTFFEHLPEGFLLRHAIELYLKSGIIIMHRRLRLPFGPDANTPEPMLQAGGDWKPLYKSHGIADLYGYWKSLITTHEVQLRGLCKFPADWSIPKELDDWMGLINKADPRSTYFRYPISHDPAIDKMKSPYKVTPVEGLFPADLPEGKKVHALIVKDEDDQLVQAYVLDESTNRDVLDALWKGARMLGDFHAMMRFELTGGW